MKNKETDRIYLEVETKIIPKSSRNEIVGREGETVTIKVTAPPVDGKANKAVIGLLSKRLDIPKRDIRIVSGEKSRIKRIRIYGLSINDFSKIIG